MDSESEPQGTNPDQSTDNPPTNTSSSRTVPPYGKQRWVSKIKRRDFTIGAIGFATGIALYGAYDYCKSSITKGPNDNSNISPPSSTPTESIRLADTPVLSWIEPEIRKSDPVKKVLRTQLVIDFADFVINGDPVKLRCYEGQMTGPTLRARPGDTLYITLVNRLQDVADNPDNPVCHEGAHVTNLHTHGLHVDPTDGDNVLKNKVKPGETKTFRFVIPEDHHPGTFWYHPHKHGSVALQVANGLAGALIIEGDIDKVPEIAAAAERIFVFQQAPYNKQNPGTVECDDLRATKFDRYTTVNGVAKPRLQMQPGEVQRWRFIHAGIKEKLRIQLDKHQLYVIAHDGITTGHLAPVDMVDLNPGYRVDVLVKAKKLDDPTKPEIYNLQDLLSVSTGSSPTEAAGLLEEKERPQYLAEVVIMGQETDMKLPEESVLGDLIPLKDLGQESIAQNVIMEFNRDTTGTDPFEFYICWPKDKLDCDTTTCKHFDERTIHVKLNTVDQWEITTCNARPRPPHHPFHIHVNPFQIMTIAGVAPDPRKGEKVWGDTLLIEKDRPVVLRTKYTKFTGETVLHCHILDHEDLGMMIKVNIQS